MNIDRFARWYRGVEYAAFGRALERRRFAYLDRLSEARRVLILGEGDGRTLARVLETAPRARVEVVEISGKMIELAKWRAGNPDRVEFRQEDARASDWPVGQYDGIVTNFFLDCLKEEEARRLTERLAGALAPGGVWIVGEFAIPGRGWRKWHAAVWVRVMYGFFAVVSGLRVGALPPIEKLLAGAGLRCVEWEEERWGLIRSEVWERNFIRV